MPLHSTIATLELRRYPPSARASKDELLKTDSLQGDFGQVLYKKDTVPGSDGAGVVKAVGSKVTSFHKGDRVCTHLTVGLPDDYAPGFVDITSGLGHKVDGTLQKYGVFHETSLVNMPSNLTFLEAATLTCSGLVRLEWFHFLAVE